MLWLTVDRIMMVLVELIVGIFELIILSVAVIAFLLFLVGVFFPEVIRWEFL